MTCGAVIPLWLAMLVTILMLGFGLAVGRYSQWKSPHD